MRATTTLAVSSLTLLLAGCSGGMRLASVPPGCTSTTSIAVTYTADGPIMVNNECIHVMGGSTITLTFSPTPPLENARTRYRLVFGNRWLKGTNDDSAHPERIVLTVPTLEDDGDEDEDFEEFKYIIKVKGSDTLDPRVVVEE